jgi:hypothetical protein
MTALAIPALIILGGALMVIGAWCLMLRIWRRDRED